MAWGFYRVPERDLRLLGPVRGRDVLELGCGSAYWSAGLRKRGARTVGIDLSRPRLLQALRVQRTMRTAFPLVRCDAERLPFRDRSFDVAFADWGAFTFSDPHRAIPEAARILRVGGVLVLATGSPWRALAQTGRMGRLGRTLRRDYFGLTSTREPDLTVFHLGYSDWVRLFLDCGLRVERLEEPRAPKAPRSSFLTRQEQAWGRRWPLESIWRVRKEPRRRPARSVRGTPPR